MATIKIINLFSPNFEKNRRSNKYIKSIVLHYTGMQSERESLYRLCDSASKVSSHYLINKKGDIYKDDSLAIHKSSGSRQWTDTDVVPGESYCYSINAINYEYEDHQHPHQ